MAAAVSAKQIDNRARRAQLIEAAYEEMSAIVSTLRAGREGEFQTVLKGEGGAERPEVIEFVPSGDVLNLLRAFSTVAKTAIDMEKVDAGVEIEAAKSLIHGIMDGLRAKTGGQ